jgi:hypothetical protein
MVEEHAIREECVQRFCVRGNKEYLKNRQETRQIWLMHEDLEDGWSKMMLKRSKDTTFTLSCSSKTFLNHKRNGNQFMCFKMEGRSTTTLL